MSRKPEEYKAIAVWNQLMGGQAYYAALQQQKAASENAPVDAIYKMADGVWKTVGEIENKAFRERVERILQDA